MVNFINKPLLEHQILQLIKYKIKRVFILSGHLSHVILSYFNNKKNFNIEIVHIVEKKPLGTAGALKQLEGLISKKFLVIYGDTYFNLNLNKFINFDFNKKAKYGTLLIHPNDHPYDSDLVVVRNDMVESFVPKPHKTYEYRNLVNAAFYILNECIFDSIIENESSDLARDVFPVLPKFSFASYLTSEYIKDIGTPKRLSEVENLVISGIPDKKNLINKQKAIFFDRDGVININKNPYNSFKNFELYNDFLPSIKFLRKLNFLIIIVTNQPAIAKGFITIEELDKIHSIIDQKLLAEKLFIDDIYFCPHHPESGFEGEITELKIKCNCRKPNNGMILEAINHYNIDPKLSWIIGDSLCDIEAGLKSNLNTIFLDRKKSDKIKFFQHNSPIFTINNLSEISKIIN